MGKELEVGARVRVDQGPLRGRFATVTDVPRPDVVDVLADGDTFSHRIHDRGMLTPVHPTHGGYEPSAEDDTLKAGDRVHVEGWAPRTDGIYARGFGTVRIAPRRNDEAWCRVELDYIPQGAYREKAWWFKKADVTPLHPKGGECKPPADDSNTEPPLAILAKAAEEVLQYHVAPAAADGRGLDGITGSLSVGVLRDLVRQARREGAI